MKKFLMAFFCFGVAMVSLTAQARYRDLTLSVAGGTAGGLMDYDRLENMYSWSVSGSYWLNDTSTIDLSITSLTGDYTVDVFRPGESDSSTRPDWNMFVGALGFQWRPDLDILLDLGMGGGIGYEAWQIKSDVVKDRSGGSPIYYLQFDAAYPIRPWLSVGAYVKPFYAPITDRLDKSITIYSNGDTHKTYDDVKYGLVWDGGINLTFRVY
jgi:hypothetical protein